MSKEEGSLWPPRRCGLVLVCWKGGSRNEEVDAAPLELGLRREDQDEADYAQSTGHAEGMIEVGHECFADSDGARDLLDEAVRVDDPNGVQSSAGKDTC